LYDDALTASGVDAGVKLGLLGVPDLGVGGRRRRGTSGVGYFATRIIGTFWPVPALVPKVTLLSWSLRFVTLPAKENTRVSPPWHQLVHDWNSALGASQVPPDVAVPSLVPPVVSADPTVFTD
jgi:hypothetical protein